MNKIHIISTITALLLMSQVSWAGEKACSDKGKKKVCPDSSNKVCEAVPVTKSVKKSAYEVECKEICIPSYTFSFSLGKLCGLKCDTKDEKNCGREGQPKKCGRVKTVKVLKKVDGKAGEKCTYEWKIRDGKGCETKKGGSAAVTPAPQPVPAATRVPAKAATKVAPQIIQPVVFRSFTVSDQ
jgi:hypothetical protein